jgi:hypothetical protein
VRRAPSEDDTPEKKGQRTNDRATPAMASPLAALTDVHQLWIGPNAVPTACIESWSRGLDASLRHVLWDEDRLEREGIREAARRRGVLAAIDAIPSWNGKADVWRWLILAERGGVFLDADCFMVRCIRELLVDAPKEKTAMVAFENEALRGPGCFPECDDIPQDVPLLAAGFMAMPAHHAIAEQALAEISRMDTRRLAASRPWRSVGPGLLTRVVRRMMRTAKDWPRELLVLPSYAFYPRHCTGQTYRGHGRVYADQLWNSTENKRAEEAGALAADLPEDAPAVSVLVCSRDVKAAHLRACLDSILHQAGAFRMELVWVDDGSDAFHSVLLDRCLDDVARRCRWMTFRRIRSETSVGVARALQMGLEAATHDLVARMDADDIMTLDRLESQLAWMDANPEVVCVGAQVAMFRDGEAQPHAQTYHPAELQRDELAAYAPENLPRWIANHPTLLFRKRAIVDVGGYRAEYNGVEDYDLVLRLVGAHGRVCTIDRVLLYYRIHPNQVTYRKDARRAELQDVVAREFVERVRAMKTSAVSESASPSASCACM